VNWGRRTTAVLLLAHGSPDSAEEVPEYLKHVTGGRSLPPQVVEEITDRYRLVGSSPLTHWTVEQAIQLEKQLAIPVYIAMRNWKPFIPDVLRKMVRQGIAHAVIICLAPQNSRTSVGLYRKAVESNGGRSFSIDFVESWHDHPLLVKAFAERLAIGLEAARREATSRIPVLFTAHSVPQCTISAGDPYQEQARRTAELVAEAATLESDDWQLAFQSQGVSGGPWIGPRVEDVLTTLSRRGTPGVLVQTIGFLADHVEVLYDIDIAARKFAQKLGLRLWRAESLNASPWLTAALADIVRCRLRASGDEI